MTKDERTELIKALVANKHSGFTTGDEAILEAASDERLESFRVASDARQAEADKIATEKANPRQLTEAEFLTSAPPEIRSLVGRLKAQETARKTELVGLLKAAQSEYSETELSTMTLENLERMARFAKIEENEVPANYMGRGIPRAASAGEKENDVYANPPDPYAEGLKALAAKQAH